MFESNIGVKTHQSHHSHLADSVYSEGFVGNRGNEPMNSEDYGPNCKDIGLSVRSSRCILE